MYKLVDLIQRRVNSVIFRFLLIFYGVILIVNYRGAVDYIYIPIFIIYLLLYFVLLTRDWPKIRLINDFLLILSVCYGKDPSDILVFMYMILPIANSVNFTGTKKSFLLFVYPIILFFILICAYNHNFNLQFAFSNLKPLVPIVFLFIIDLYTSLRAKVKATRDELIEIVDTYYIDGETIKKPHKVYRKIIKKINNDITGLTIEKLFCLRILNDADDKLAIVNSSNFVFEFKILDDDFVSKIREEKHLSGIGIMLDNKAYTNSFSTYISLEDIEYVFILVSNQKHPPYYELISFFDTLSPVFARMAKVLLNEKRLQDLKNEENIKLSVRSQYVTRAIKVMHYIRNRLGSLNNLVSMVEKYQEVPKEKLDQYNTLLVRELSTAKTELSNITLRANYLLEKNNNPFNFSQVEKHSTTKLYSVLNKNVLSFFPYNEIITKVIHDEKTYVHYNEEGLEIFLSDWLNNIKKYRKNYLRIEFEELQSEVRILFINDHDQPTNMINKLVSDLMSHDRNEILKRTTHGLFQIKTILEEMGVIFLAFISENTNQLCLQLHFQISKDEVDSNF